MSMTLRFTLLTLLALFATSAQAQSTHDTGSVTLGVYADGNIGVDNASFTGPGHTFGGTNGLFSGNFMAGTTISGVLVGEPYRDEDWVQESPLAPLSTPFDSPYEAFEQGFEAIFNDGGLLGLRVVQRSYSSSAAPYEDVVVLEYQVTNTTNATIGDAYFGLFFDYDIGNAGANSATYDAATSSVRVFEPGTSAPVFGTALLSSSPSGYGNVNLASGSFDQRALTLMSSTNEDFGGPTDINYTLGAGPFELAAGESRTVTFAAVAGANESDFLTNAAALNGFVVSNQTGPEARTNRLALVGPNPTSSAARVEVSLNTPEVVRVTLTDMLGRTVAVIHDGVLAGGTATLELDATNLAPGLYTILAQGQTFYQSRVLSVVR